MFSEIRLTRAMPDSFGRECLVVFQSCRHGADVFGTDIYTFLASGAEADGAYFVMEGLVPFAALYKS